jgi:hypothetical protein
VTQRLKPRAWATLEQSLNKWLAMPRFVNGKNQVKSSRTPTGKGER